LQTSKLALRKKADSDVVTSGIKREISFPLSVSLVLMLIIFIFGLIVYKAQARLFSSIADRLVLHSSMYLFSGLIIMWILLLLSDSFNLNLGKTYKPAKWLLFFVYYPLGRIPSVILPISKEAYRESFLRYQNNLLLALSLSGRIQRILLLLPHCLQYHDCKIRITRDINDCADCGDCDICHLKDLGKKYAISIGIANGGTLARKLVQDTHPDYIIAVACHRDLTDGLRESWHYPVYAILNERPFGPCFDTKVDVQEVDRVIAKVLADKPKPNL
jgi:hypothetical protein